MDEFEPSRDLRVLIVIRDVASALGLSRLRDEQTATQQRGERRERLQCSIDANGCEHVTPRRKTHEQCSEEIETNWQTRS